MAAHQDINGNAQNGATNGHRAPLNLQNGNFNGTTLVDQGNELAHRFSGMLTTQIKSTMDYASLKAAETRTFVEKQVNGAVEVGQGIAKKADEIPVVHETTSYVTFMLHTAISYLFATINYIRSTALSAKKAVKTTVHDTTTRAKETVKTSVSSYRQMAYEKAKQATEIGTSLAQKFLPSPIYDLGSKFISDPVSTTRQQLPPKVVEMGDAAADVGLKYYGMAKDVTDKTKSNIDAVRNEAVKKANEAKEKAMQTIGLSKKAKEE